MNNRTIKKIGNESLTWILRGCTYLSASFIFIIMAVILVKGFIPFISSNAGLGRVSLLRFLMNDTWLVGEAFKSNLYGVGFLIISTIYIAFLALLLAFPIGVFTALFIARIAPRKVAELFRTIIEILASIPSIIYGLFGYGVVLELVYNFSKLFGIQSKGGNSILATVIILALMIIPTITTLSEVSIRSVDNKLVEGSLALGASQMQTNVKVVLQKAKSGIFSSAILGVGRALGEATAVSIVAGGRQSGITFNIFESTGTLTTAMLQGIKETTGLDYDIRFSVGIVLMVVILITNITLNQIKKRIGNLDV